MKKQMKRVAALFAVLTVLLALCCASVAAEEAAVTETSADLNREELVMQAGKTQTLKFQLLPAASSTEGTVWSSDNEDVAIVSGAVVTAVAEGTATITATSPNGLTDTCKVTVVGGKRVLDNGSFEQENQTAWVLDGAVIEENGGHGDTACVKVAYGNTLSQTLKNLEANTTYVLFARTKMSEDAAMTLAVKAGAETVLEKELTLGKSWGTRSVEFTTPAELTGDLTLLFNGPADGLTYWLDGIVISKKAADADLVVDALDWDGGDGQVKPDTALTFKVTVSNIGTADVTEAFKVDVAFGTESILTLTHEGGLKAGESVTLTSEAWNAVEGDKMISARVNPDLAVEESNYATNNTYQINLRVAADRYAPAYNADVVAEAGMFDLTFSDDFNDLSSVDTLASGDTGYKWYVSRQWAQTDMTREDYFVKDGVFTLEHLDSKYAIGASTIDCDTHTGYSFNKGYLEVKIRIPEPIKNEGVKSYPAIWSLPPGKWCEISGQNKHWIEMDWLEYYGRDNGYYTITMHEQSYAEDGTLSQYTSGDNGRHGLNDKEWHVMGFLWEEDSLRCFLDGEPIRDQFWSADSFPDPVHQNVEGEIKFDGVFDIFDTQECMLYIAGTRGMPLELDYVRIWQLGGDAPEESAPEQTPETGAASAVPALVTLLTASAAALALTRKRK